MFSGASTIERAKELQTQITQLLQRGGFQLRQWASNSEDLMEHIPLPDRQKQSIDFHDDVILKTLGVNWTPKDDRFVFRVNLGDNESKPTKRTILSDIARLYDPPGWL